MRSVPCVLATALLAATAAAHAAPRGHDPSTAASEASLLSVAYPVALAGSAASVVLMDATVLTLYAIKRTGDGIEWVLERASDGARVVLRFGGDAALAAAQLTGTAVRVVATSAGFVLSCAGEAVAFVPNAVGQSLIHDERIGS